MSEIIGPYSMFDFTDGAGPFINRVQNGANRGGVHVITGPFRDSDENELYSQIVPADLAAPAKWSDYTDWIVYDPLANVLDTRVYVQLNETQYNEDDVPSKLPNAEIVDEDGNPIRLRKWFEWRAANQTHWKAQASSTYAVPSTSWGFYLDLRTWMDVDAAYPGKVKSQREWDELAATLPPDDLIPWPEV